MVRPYSVSTKVLSASVLAYFPIVDAFTLYAAGIVATLKRLISEPRAGETTLSSIVSSP